MKKRFLEVLHVSNQKTRVIGENTRTLPIIDDWGVHDQLDERVRIPLTDYVAFDLETTGLSPDKHEIIEIAAARFEGGLAKEIWSSLVKPRQKIPLKVSRLTGIYPDHLEGAPDVSEVWGEFLEFCGDLPLVGHNSSFDASFIKRYLPDFPPGTLYDTLELGRIVLPGLKTYRLLEFADSMGIKLEGAHRAANDAVASGMLFRSIQEGIGRIPIGDRKKILDVMGPDWGSSSLFESAQVVKAPEPEGPLDLFSWAKGQAVETPQFNIVENLNETVSQALIQGEDRMVHVRANFDSACTAAHAASRWALSSGQRVLLIGFPEGVTDERGKPYPQAVVPGQYLCRNRLDALLSQAKELDADGRRFLASVIAWASLTKTGSFDELQVYGSGEQVAARLKCPPKACCAQSCPHIGACFRQKALLRADTHRVLMVSPYDLLREKAVYPELFGALLVWESHHSPRWQERVEPQVDLAALQTFVRRKGLTGEVPSLDNLYERANALSGRSEVSAEGLKHTVEKVFEQTKNVPEETSPEPFIAAMKGFLLEDPDDSVRVLWQKRTPDGQNSPILSQKAVWPGKKGLGTLRQVCGGSTPMIFLSSVAGTLRKSPGLLYSLGIDGVQSDVIPVTNQQQTLLVTPDDAPPATGQAYARYVTSLLSNLAKTVRQGVCAVFPSRALLQDVYYLLSDEAERHEIAVYGQGIDSARTVFENISSPNTFTMALVRTTPFATDPVPACTVICRIPFSPPSLTADRRRDRLDALGMDGFVESNVKEAALLVREWGERMLIRRSALVIADARVSKSRWGKDFMNVFEDLPSTSCPQDSIPQRIKGWLDDKAGL